MGRHLQIIGRGKDIKPLHYSHGIGLGQYELTNHLGNVLTTISDRKNTIAIAKFTAEIQSSQDYYPFGSLMPGRKYSSNAYRFGFNGMEKDDEITGVTGSHLDFGTRVYDSRLGRWLSVDPLAAKFESWSPFHFSANNPIRVKDKNGEDWVVINSDGYYQNEIVEDSETHGFQVIMDDGNIKRYVFNDQKNDLGFALENIYKQEKFFGYSDIEPIANFVKDDYVKTLQKDKMSRGESVWGIRHIYANIESRGGKMDAMQYLFGDFLKGKMSDLHRNEVNDGIYPSDVNFFIHIGGDENKAYNASDFGNYNWGGAMYELGFKGNGDLDYIFEKANSNSENMNDAPDTDADQQAIKDGYNNAKKRP